MIALNKPPPLRHSSGRRSGGRRWTCFYYLVKDNKKTKLNGRTFLLPIGKDKTQELDLFPIGALCAILGRTYRTIYKWEAEYGFPAALFQLEDSGRFIRWYSRYQLTAVEKLYAEFGRLGGKNRDKLKDFIKLVTVIWTGDRVAAEV